MLKGIYELLTGPLGPLGLPIDPIYEWLIMGIVGIIVHEIAWQASPGGEFGSIIYWITKLLAILVIWAMDSVNINQIFKKNKILQARIFYFLLGISLIYLVTNFIMDIFSTVKIL